MDAHSRANEAKPATAARMYDYYLGGVHNFPADQEAAKRIIGLFPEVKAAAVANRAFLRRVVRHLAELGVRQFLDIGSGIPTVGNVHEIAQQIAPDTRVVYVDIDVVAVSESLEILDGNSLATAVQADMRRPETILNHQQVRRVLDFSQPIGLLLFAVLPFIADYAHARQVVSQFVTALPSGSYLAISHGAIESFPLDTERAKAGGQVYTQQTTTRPTPRTRSDVAEFFAGLDLLEPGVVWLPEWRPRPDEEVEFADDPPRSGGWGGVGRKR